MVAALMALVQASTVPRKYMAGDGGSAPESSGAAPARPAGGMLKDDTPRPTPEALQHLVDVVTKLADMDKLIEQARAMVPEDGEARKWHLVSLTALEWTRRAQSEQVQVLLEKVRAYVTTQATPACREELARVAERAAVATDSSPDHPGAESPAAARAGSLRTDLEKLRGHDPDCCLIVRRIKHLGIHSASILEEHFGRAGGVAAVYVSHSFEKPCQKRRNGRVRPAALGFVVMATKDGAERALAAGGEQLVGQARIAVQIFEPFADDLQP